MFTPEIAEYVFVFLLVTMVVDIFICVLYPAYACLLYFSLYCTVKFKEHLFIDAPWIYLITVILFALMLVSYTYLWKYLNLILNKTFLKKSNAVSADQTVGSKGTFRVINGDYFCNYNSDLYAIEKDSFNPSDYSDGDSVTITSLNNGKVNIN